MTVRHGHGIEGHDHLTREEAEQVHFLANEAVEASDMDRYADAFMVWHRGEWSGQPQVMIWPILSLGQPVQ